jgi:hypothetical protein
VTALEEAFKFAPAGSESVVENMKTAIAAAQSTYNNFASINKQIYATVEGAVEQNVATAKPRRDQSQVEEALSARAREAGPRSSNVKPRERSRGFFAFGLVPVGGCRARWR